MRVLLLIISLLVACPAWSAILVSTNNGNYIQKPTLQRAATDPDTAGKTIVVTSALSAVQSNISSATLHAWPADRKLEVRNGGSINPTTKFKITAGLTQYVSPDGFGGNTTPGTTDMTTAVQLAFDTGLPVKLRPTTYLVGNLKIKNTGFTLTGESKTKSILKFKAGTTKGLQTENFGVRADSDSPTPYQLLSISLSNFTVDLNSMTNADTTYGIAIEDGWDHTVWDVIALDSLNEASYRWGFVLGRMVYTTSVTNCTFGRTAILAQPTGGQGSNVNITTTVNYYKLSGWHVKLRYAADIAFYGAVLQKDADKFDINYGSGNITIIGGDFENSGYFVRVTDADTVNNIFTAGNSFAGFTGQMFGGTAGRPNTVTMFDEFTDPRTIYVTGITRSGTVATVQCDTTLANGIFKYMCPVAGEWITISGSVAPFNVERVQVVTVDNVNNRCTYTVANSGATTATGTILAQVNAGYRYTGLLGGALMYDPLAGYLQLTKYKKLSLVGGQYGGLFALGSDEATQHKLISLDDSDRVALGDGTNANLIIDAGNFRNTKVGKGIVLVSPDGTKTKLISIDNSGAIVTADY